MTDFFAYNIASCIRCKKCTKVCPSARNGGIIPDQVINSLNENGNAEGVWKCLQCHRCSDECPKNIDVCEIILKLRNESSEIPQRFLKSKETVRKCGRTVPVSKFTQSQRAELGLPEDTVSEETIAFVSEVLEENK